MTTEGGKLVKCLNWMSSSTNRTTVDRSVGIDNFFVDSAKKACIRACHIYLYSRDCVYMTYKIPSCSSCPFQPCTSSIIYGKIFLITNLPKQDRYLPEVWINTCMYTTLVALLILRLLAFCFPLRDSWSITIHIHPRDNCLLPFRLTYLPQTYWLGTVSGQEQKVRDGYESFSTAVSTMSPKQAT